MTMTLSGKTVLVTGASSGLGRAIALQLALEHGAKVIAVARSKDALEALRDETKGLIEIAPCDLADMDSVQTLWASLQQQRLDAAVLNAGTTLTGPFSEQDWPRLEQMLKLNITSTTFLARQCMTRLPRDGAMMLVASLGGETPMPFQAAYGASKAYLISLGFAVAQEAKATGPTMTICAPGGIATRMTKGTEFDGQRGHMMDPSLIAAKAIKAMQSGKTLVIPGVHNKVMAAAIKVLPRRLVTAILNKQFRSDMS
ncbi:MAG: SDR family NAD(P)-dependent oxidoreductase [Pseudomonadota bacterium]